MNLKDFNIGLEWTLFLDRDGTINEKFDGDYVKDWKQFKFLAGAIEALKSLNRIFERDLRDLSHITSLTDFRNVMQLLALRTASIVDQTGISRDTGISQPTVHRYINLLEASNLFIRLRPFTKIKAKSLTKSPKGYFIDPGLACRLAGYRSPEAIDDKFKENLFKSLILLNLLVIADIYQMNIYHWRTREGKEVDFVLEYGRDILPVEVKLSGRVAYGDIQNILYFIGLNPRAAGGIVIYCGNRIQKLSPNVFAVPWQLL